MGMGVGPRGRGRERGTESGLEQPNLSMNENAQRNPVNHVGYFKKENNPFKRCYMYCFNDAHQFK